MTLDKRRLLQITVFSLLWLLHLHPIGEYITLNHFSFLTAYNEPSLVEHSVHASTECIFVYGRTALSPA
jgi:hypothetical protein